MNGTKRDMAVVAAMLLTFTHVSLIWSFRFLPVVDYPVWLFEAKILRELLNSGSDFHRFYELMRIPVPNLTFTFVTSALGWIVPLEAAGKIFLTVCAIGFPWGVWYSVRRLAPGANPVTAYLGFPFALSYFLLSNQNYFLALTLFIWMVGFFLPRIDRASLLHWIALSIGLILIYFTHGFVFIIVVVFFLGVFVQDGHRARGMLLRFLVALVPAAICAGWYVLSVQAPLRTGVHWDMLSLARNVLKPLMPFVKSYGVDVLLPLTILNIVWLGILVVIIAVLATRGWRLAQSEKRLLPVILFCLAMMLLLPDPALGVVQPGARFGLPLLVLVVLGTARVNIHGAWKGVILTTSLVVTAYNLPYFWQFNTQAGLFYGDLTENVDFRRPFYVVGLDWPAGTSIWNEGSPSVNGLSFVPLYCTIERGEVSWIFETGIIKAKEEIHKDFPELYGSEIQEWYRSIFNRVDRFASFKSIAVVGAGEEAQKAVHQLEEVGFRAKLKRPVWAIMESR